MSSKIFSGVWYPEEDPSHMFALKFLQECKVSYCAIDHSRDLDDDGNIKKLHTHVIIKFPNERYLDNVCKLLGISPIYLQEVIDLKSIYKYILHIGTNKTPYRLDEAYGPLVTELESVVTKTNKNDRIFLLLDVLDKLPVPATYRQFLSACCSCGLYNEFRQLGGGVHALLDEHNSYYI